MEDEVFEKEDYGLWIKSYYETWISADADVIKSVITDANYEISEHEESIIALRCKIRALNLILLEREVKEKEAKP